MGYKRWTKINAKKLPKAGLPVHIFAQFNDMDYGIFLAHHDQGVWMIYDSFTFKWRVFRFQRAVTHWQHSIELPSSFKAKNKKRKEVTGDT